MSFFFKKKPSAPLGPPEFLIVGLGNPGRDYETTRHNAGFLCLDMLADELSFSIDRIKYKSLVGDTEIDGHRCLVMKPQTFMNNSGEAVREAAQFYKIPPERVIVIYDDTALPLGKLRIRRKGSDGGHNGIKSITLCLNSDAFPRLKLGVGAKPHPDYDLKDYVLSHFHKDEIAEMKTAMRRACEALPYLVGGDIDGAMSRFSK